MSASIRFSTAIADGFGKGYASLFLLAIVLGVLDQVTVWSAAALVLLGIAVDFLRARTTDHARDMLSEGLSREQIKAQAEMAPRPGRGTKIVANLMAFWVIGVIFVVIVGGWLIEPMQATPPRLLLLLNPVARQLVPAGSQQFMTLLERGEVGRSVLFLCAHLLNLGFMIYVVLQVTFCESRRNLARTLLNNRYGKTLLQRGAMGFAVGVLFAIASVRANFLDTTIAPFNWLNGLAAGPIASSAFLSIMAAMILSGAFSVISAARLQPSYDA